MANYIATDTQFNATADAIRAKTGSNAAIEWDEDTGFADDIAAISAGVDVSGVTATPADVLSPKVFVDENGDEQTGTIATKSSSDLTASGATVSVPAGYYPTNASKSVTSGSAGTPTATKGTVSNNQVTVTPAVTNTTGYITGGTKTGTAVTVKASELVSGTKTISGSGSTDVTNYASASVAAGSASTPASTIAVNPTITVNSAGLITASYSGSKSITPTVSAGYVSAGTAGTVSTSGSATQQLPTIPDDDLFPESDTVTYSTFYTSWTFEAGKYIKRNIHIPRVQSSATKDIIKYGSRVGMLEDGEAYEPTYITGTFTKASTVSSGQIAASAGQILSGYSAWVDGQEVQGTIASKTSNNLTASGLTVTVPAGYYASQVTKSCSDSNLSAANIKSGTTIFGVTGTYTGVDTSNAVMFGVTWVDGSFDNAGNFTSSSTIHYTSNLLPVVPSTKYNVTAYQNTTATSLLYVGCYNGTTFLDRKTVMSGRQKVGDRAGSFTTPANCTNIRIAIAKNTDQIKING